METRMRGEPVTHCQVIMGPVVVADRLQLPSGIARASELRNSRNSVLVGGQRRLGACAERLRPGVHAGAGQILAILTRL